MKILLRTLVLFLLCIGFLFLMHRLGFLRTGDIVNAFESRPLILLMIAGVQLLTAFVMMIRYSALLRVLGISAPLRQVSSATFVSTAVGQWAPGSLAVVEVLRVGLMVGSQSAAPKANGQSGRLAGIKARLAIASFADRLIGFLGILVLGFIFSAYLCFQSISRDGQSGLLNGPGFLLLSSGIGSFLLLTTPLLVRLGLLRNLERRWKVHGLAAQSFSGRWRNMILGHFETLRHDVDAASRHPRRLLVPLLISMSSLLLTSLSLYLSALAIGESLSFLQIVCAYPLISLSALLPLGFAGIGGYQLIMASIFGIFAVSPALVASAGVLQSAVLLLVNTAVGLLYAHISSGQIRAIFNRRSSAQTV
jgi:uncharacterized membrane protein YbhN (UPF0104 family)